MRISDWSSDVGSSDLHVGGNRLRGGRDRRRARFEPYIVGQRDIHRRGFEAHRIGRREETHREQAEQQIGRASCRERVCQYVSISVVAVSLKKKKHITQKSSTLHIEIHQHKPNTHNKPNSIELSTTTTITV